MKQAEVNSLITDRVKEIEDDTEREFIEWILRFERENMDKEQPHYKADYREKLDELDLDGDE